MTVLAWCLWAFCRRRDIAQHRQRRRHTPTVQVAYLDLMLATDLSPRLRDYALARRGELA